MDKPIITTTIAGREYRIFQPIGAFRCQMELSELQEKINSGKADASEIRQCFVLMVKILQLTMPDLDLSDPEIEKLDFEEVFAQMQAGLVTSPLELST